MGAARGSTGQRRARPRTLPSRVSAGPMGGVGCLPGQRFPTPPDFLHDLSRRARRRQLLTQEAPRQASAATFRWTSTSRLPHTKSLSLSCLNLPIYLRGVGGGVRWLRWGPARPWHGAGTHKRPGVVAVFAASDYCMWLLPARPRPETGSRGALSLTPWLAKALLARKTRVRFPGRGPFATAAGWTLLKSR